MSATGLSATGSPAVTSHRPPGESWRSRAAMLACAVLVGAAAVISGMNLGSANKAMVVLPLAACLGLGLAVLAMTRFSGFVLLLLGVRSSLDLFKLSGSSAGNTATNSAASRGMDPSSIVAILFLLASVVWLSAQLRSGRSLRGTPLRTAMLVFVAAGAISVIGAQSPQAAALEVSRILSVAMMFIILEQLITDRAMLVKTLVAAYAGLAFPLLYTISGFLLGGPASEVKGSFTRITGPFSQSNTFARFLAFMLIFGVALYPSLSRRLRLLFAPVLLLCAGFMLMTLTRGAILASVLAIVLVAVLQRRTRLITGFVAAGLLALVLVPGLGARFATLSAGQQLPGGPETGNSLEWRLNYWTEVLPLANRNPVTGIGLNMTQYQTDAEKQPHNDFIRAYVETGVFGLGGYLAMHFFLMRGAVVAMGRSVKGTLEHSVSVGALGCAVCFFVSSAGANVMSNVVSLWYLFTFAAAASYVARRDPATGFVPTGRLVPQGRPAPRPTGATQARP